MYSVLNLRIGSSDMDGCYLRTHLIERPSVYLYYKGMEDDNTCPDALNVVVAFTTAEALIFDEDAALRICMRLNEDREVLKANGYGEFEVRCAI